jgi:diamine N-acetyltransferase
MRVDESVFPLRSFSLDSCLLEPLNANHAPEIARCIVAMDPWLTLGYEADPMGRYLSREDPGLSRYAVRADGCTVGVLGVRYPWLLGPHLELIAIFAGHRSRGLGAELLGWLEQRGRFRHVWVTVSTFNERALRFYQRLGYHRVTVLKDLIRSGYDEILLRKAAVESLSPVEVD